MTRLAIFFLDAVRFQDLDPNKTPFLFKASQDGMRGPLETVLAYEGIAATLFTGTYPSKHGIWFRYYLDPDSSPFKWVGPLAPLLDTIDSSQPSVLSKGMRYQITRLSGALGGISYFPGVDHVPFRQLTQMNFSLKRNPYEPQSFGKTPSLFDILREHRISFEYFDHGFFDSDRSVFERAFSARPSDVMTFRFLDLDTVSHRSGLESPERLRTLRQTDTFVERIASKLRRNSSDLSILSFADHGMVPVEGQVDVQRQLNSAGLRPFRDFGMFLDSTMARFWGNENMLERVRTVLLSLKCGRILSQSDLLANHLPLSSMWGDIIFLLEPGFVISPSFFESRQPVKAMHGYDLATPGLDSFVVLHSPLHAGPQQLLMSHAVDITPTALDLLGLDIPSYCEGHSLLKA